MHRAITLFWYHSYNRCNDLCLHVHVHVLYTFILAHLKYVDKNGRDSTLKWYQFNPLRTCFIQLKKLLTYKVLTVSLKT